MNKERMKRTMLVAACMMSLTLGVSAAGAARDSDNDFYRPANFNQQQQYGYPSVGVQPALQTVATSWRDNDWDRHGRWGYRDDGRKVAYQFGYQDGSAVARRDIERRNRYNPNPRGKFDDEDRGYRREYGNKDAYKAEYARAYRAGYDATMRYRY